MQSRKPDSHAESHRGSFGTIEASAAVLAFVCLLAIPATATAQNQGGGVINLEETVIEGNIQKPEAFYILQHASLNYQELKPKKSFIPELMQTVDQDPVKSTRPTRSGDENP